MPPPIPESLNELRSAILAGEVTPRAAAEAALARANSNASRNVYIALDAERVQRAADELPQRFPGASKPLLYGLPVSLKDCFDLAGFPTSAGTRFYASRGGTARGDSAVAEALRAQGALIIGKTHMHPLAYGITGENPEYRDCRQPRDAGLLTGGSSSGAAASVQEGSAVAAIGTDTGGSIRVPAALCGLAGYRAGIEVAEQRGLWRGGVHLAPSFDTLGWLFRDLRDGALLSSALFGLGPAQVTAAEGAAARGTAASFAAIRVGRVPDAFLHDCEREVLDSYAQTAQRLRHRGATIVPIDTSFWDDAMAIYAPIQASEAAAIHGPITNGDFSHFEASIAERLAWGASLPATEIAERRRQHAAFRDRMDALLREHDYLIVPCAPMRHLRAGADHSQTRRAILRYTLPMSLAATPVVTIPCADGAGVQLVAAGGADARLLAFAAHCAA
jgi:Asp-tRNA(Asn)/Glu-tRNA(Gln) amidotransferase A subunit family amidase